MGKKILLSGNRLYLIAGGGGAVAAVLIAIFVFGIGLDFVNPLYEPPTQLTSQQIQENEQIIFNINGVTEDLTQQYVDGELGDITQEELDQMIQKEIQNLSDSANPTEITNQTEFSEDTPIEQIADIITPPSLDLISRVTKIDSTGARETVEKITKIGPLSVFIEEISKKDFSTGFLEVELILKGKPSLFYRGTGTFEIIINGISLTTAPINLSIDTQSTATGFFPVGIISPTGIASNIYTFSFADNINKFPEGQITKLAMNSSLQITETQPIQCVTIPCDPIETMFGITDTELFTMDIRRDANLIVVTDQQTGELLVVYPTDSKVIVTTVPYNILGTNCVIGFFYGYVNGDYSLLPKNVGSSSGSTCIAYTTSVIAGTAPAPSVTGLILLDSNGQLITNKPGGTGQIFNEFVTRNANYTLKVSSPDLTTKLSYEKTQEIKSYTCWSTGTPKYIVTSSSTPAPSGCGFGGVCFGTTTYSLRTNGINIGATQCNFP